MAKIRVSPKEPNPTHHVALTGPDGKSIGLVLTDAAGNPDPTGIASQPFPRTAIKTYSGASDLDSEEPPFNPISQRDWSGGMGKLVQDEAANRFRESHGVNTSYPNLAFLQGQEEHMIGYLPQNSYDPDSVTFLNDVTYPYHAISFVPTENYSAKYADVYAKREGIPATGSVGIHLYGDTAGEPGTLLGSATLVTVTSLSTKSDQYDNMMITVSGVFATPVALTAGTTYWLKVDWPGPDYEGAMKLATDTNNKTGGLKSATGSVWLASSEAFYYNVRADAAQFDAIFLKYKGADYMVTKPVDKATASKLYIAGDRGMADSNAGQLNKVIDATKTWITNIFAGAYVYIPQGPGAQEERPFRKIVSNTATELVVDKNWIVTHTTSTQYIILGSKLWTHAFTLSSYCNDAVSAAEAIYFANGQYYNWADEGTGAPVITTGTTPIGNKDYITAIPAQMADSQSRWVALAGMNDSTYSSAEWWALPRGGGTKNLALNSQPRPVVANVTGAISNAVRPWSEQAIGNVTATVYYDAARFVIASPFTTGNVGSIAIPVQDFTSATSITFLVYTTTGWTANQYAFMLSDTASLGGVSASITIPDVVSANTWTEITIPYAPIGTGPNASVIISIGLKRLTGTGAEEIRIMNVYLTKQQPNYAFVLPSQHANSVITYSGSQDGTNTLNPWVFGEEGDIFEIQRQNGWELARLTLPSGATQSGPHFGSAATQHGLYLYFNVGTRLQRYFNNQVDDVGPDRDDGLPDYQKGAIPWKLVSYPGRLYASYYTGNSAYDPNATGHHAIYVEQNNGWCEVARNLYSDSEPIRSIGVQATPVQRKYIMWVVGGLVMRAPISFDPMRDADYKFRPDGVIITGRYYAGRRDIEKFFKAVKVTADNLEGIYDTNDVKITLWYRTDLQTTWTALPDIFDVSPFKQVDLNNLMDATGRWVQFKIMLETDQSTISPKLYGIVIETMIRVPVKDAYTLTFKLANNDTDLQGNFEDADAKAKYDILREWLAGAKPIKLSTLDELTHGLTVYPEPIPIRRILRTYEEGGQVKTKWVCQMSLLEI